MNSHNILTGLPRLLSRVTLAVFLASALMLSACQTEEPQPEATEEPPFVEEETTTEISELEGNPSEYVGRMVTVDGDVDEIYGANVFTVSGGLFSGDLAVIVPSRIATTNVMEDDRVRITGTVQTFAGTEMETEYELDLSPEFEGELEEGEPVLIADSVTPVQEEGLFDEEGAPGDPVPEGDAVPEGGDSEY